MISYGIKSVIVLLLVVSLDVSSFDHKLHLRSEIKTNVKGTYASLLDSLIKINEDRVKSLKKLHMLNDINYGREFLRSSIENRLDDYDEALENIMIIIKLLFANPKYSYGVYDEGYPYVHPDTKHVSTGLKQKTFKEHQNNDKENIKEVLRKLRDSNSEETKKRKDSESSSDEELNGEVKSNRSGNMTKGRSYYYYEYSCGRGRVRCIKACKEAYRDACYEEYCEKDLRRSLRRACKSQCRDWFY